MENTLQVQVQIQAQELALQALADIAVIIVGAKGGENDEVILTKDAAIELLGHVNGIMHLMGHSLQIREADEEGFVSVSAEALNLENVDA